MPLPDSNIPRISKTETLEDLYKNINTNVQVKSTFGGMRSHLLAPKHDVNTMAWGVSSKAGSPNYMSTNRFQDTQYNRTFQPNSFIVFNRAPGGFNDFSLNYAKNAYNHDNSSYR